MKAFFLKFFTWWNSQTFGTQFTIWRHGVFVGEDEFGNRYYRSRFAKDPALGHERRWVVYNGYADASAIPPGWYGWMHHRIAEPPTSASYQPRVWQKPHKPNATGTAMPIARRVRRWPPASVRRPPATTRPGRRVSDTGPEPPDRHGSATFQRHMSRSGRLRPLPPRTIDRCQDHGRESTAWPLLPGPFSR